MIDPRPLTGLLEEKMKKLNFQPLAAKIFTVQIVAGHNMLASYNMHGALCPMPFFGFSTYVIYFEIKIAYFKPSHGIQMVELNYALICSK